MEIKQYFLFKLIFFLFNVNFSLSNEINNNRNSSSINNDHSQRKLADEFQPIRIYYDKTPIEQFTIGQPEFRKSLVYDAFDNCVNALKKIINVEPYNEPIKYDFSKDSAFNESFSNINPSLLTGIQNYDLVIVPLLLEEYSRFEMTSHDILRNSKGRVILSVIKISYTIDFRYRNSDKYLQYLIFHQMIHILGFSYESFRYFPGGINSVYYNVTEDSRNGIIRAYIKTTRVLNFGKKYFNCNIQGVPLENQEEGQIKIAHWEPRFLLGDIMSSLTYTPDQVLSEFTLSLLEDSGWYKVNYYTGGLMRFGKHKGCNFFTNDCSEEFENDFCPFLPGVSNSCSSGRQSRTYCNPHQKFVYGYNRYPNNWVGEEYADYCIINNNHEKEEKISASIGYFEGSCKDGSAQFGEYILYDEFETEAQRIQIGNSLGERLGLDNSFCALSSVYNSDYPNFVHYVYPMCYPMYCTNTSLTIQIKNQYVVCPVEGGKTPVNGSFSGYIYCPDYNLICTGTVMCNSMFDCIEKESLGKDSTYNYNYIPNISQNNTLLLEEYEPLINYEKSEDGKCPVECSQCREEKKCFICREGFNLIGIKYRDNNTIFCSDLNTSEGYYKEVDGIYYQCLDGCLYCDDPFHCKQCKKYHKLNEDNTECIENVKGCDIYESDFVCQKCKKGYGFIGANANRSICNTIDPKKYYTYDDVVFYPCDTNVKNCDECNNKPSLCDKCKANYYFLSDIRKDCRNDLNLSLYFTLDEGISYYPCDTNVSNCLECQNKADTCFKCKADYFFIEYNRTKCFNTREIDIAQYYTEDNGISYFPCSGAIENCYFCTNKTICTMCIFGYYFFKEDRKNCINGLDLTEHYSDDGGISYYPCDTHFENCRKCNSKNDCYLCKDNYIFVRGKRDLCFINDPDRLYNDTDGNLYPCYDNLPYCDKCFGNKNVCRNCLPNYYFVEDDRTTCHNISLKEYFTENGGESYKRCFNYISNCSECTDKNTCTRCIEGFYFVGFERVCRNDLDIRKYFTEDDGISYLPCSIMENCDFCSNRSVCEKCLDDFYLLRTDYDKCVTLNLSKHYKDGISYYPCSDAVIYCDECSSKGTCSKCINGYKALYYEDKYECRRESELENDPSVYKINDTFYAKCSDSIPNCNTCVNETQCTRCHNNYFFINDDFTKCIHRSNITALEYYQYSQIMYYSCSFKNGINHCKNCHKHITNELYCDLCDSEYAIIYGNFTFCFVRSEIGVGYYSNEERTIYYPCLDNCYICNRGDKCIQCKENFLTFADNSVCDICTVNLNYINDNLSHELVEQKTKEYINNYNDKYSFVEQYINSNQNFTITIFRTWYCTSYLLKNDYFEINNDQITNLIRTSLNSDKYYVTAYVNYQYKSYIEIYSNEENRFMNEINSICKECTEGNKIIITNNFTEELNSLGEVITTKLLENEIDIFNKDSPIFTDICKNFTIESIDVPLKERREMFFLGYDAKELLCHDIDCNINSIEMGNFTGICSCKMETDISKVFSSRPKNYNNITTEEYEEFIKSDSSVNSFLIFKCAKEAFSSSIKSNACLYITIVFLVAQATIFGFYAKSKSKPKKIEEKKEDKSKEKGENKKSDIKKKKGKKSKKEKKKKSKANPPKIGNFSITDDLEEDRDSIFERDKPDLEKEMQEKDKEMFYNDISNLSDEGRDDTCKDAQDKDIDSVILKEIKNEILNSGVELTEETLMTGINDYKRKRPVRISNIISSENEDEEEEEEEDDEEGEEEEDEGDEGYSNTSKGINEKRIKRKKKKKKKNKKTKLKFLEEPSYQGDEGGVDINDKQNKKRHRNKNKELRDSVTSKDSFSVSEINKIQNDINQKTEYISFNEAIKNPSIPFADYYWKLFQLKQPFVALFSPIKFLKIEESHIPTLVKVMRIIFILSLNIFFNILHLEQKYFRKKYEYFNDKYKLRYTFLQVKISSSELFSYGFSHAYAAGLISFLICLIIQSVLNYFFFDLKKKLSTNDKLNTKQEILQFMKSVRRCYIIFFAISLGVMVIIFYSSITFAQVYRGGVLDLIAGAIWTFIFLQIIPFLLCLVFALFRYYGIKNNKKILYDLSLAVFF